MPTQGTPAHADPLPPAAGGADARPLAAAGPLAIRCRGLCKRYGSLLAVDQLDLEVRVGECFGLLGPNGAGKTTTIEILEGLLEPTSGDVEVLGRRWSNDERHLRQRLGVTLQETHLPDKLAVVEILQLFRSFYERGRDVEEVLRWVSLEDKRDTWYERLSGGQKQRLAVACALVGSPELLFLDEPTTGLDPQSRRNLWELVHGYRRGGGTVLLTTHYMEEAERLCDRVGIVDRGKLVALGTPRELIARLVGRELLELELAREDGTPLPAGAGPPVAPEELSALAGVHGVRLQGDTFVLSVDEVHEVLPPLLAWLGGRKLRPARLATHHANLEDVFVHLTGHSLRE